MEILLISLPAVFTGVASYALYQGLQDAGQVHWKRIALTAALLLLACASLTLVVALTGGLSGFFVGLFASGTSAFSGLFLLFYLSRWRKLAGILLGVGFPIIIFTTIILSNPFDPDTIIRRNGEIIAQALSQYHADKGRYPDTLDELVPVYLDEVNQPKTMWGWLYTVDNHGFTLGYVFYIDKFGYTVCKYSKETPEWNCPNDYSTEPFHLEPTPITY